jgi:hypothetical protein
MTTLTKAQRYMLDRAHPGPVQFNMVERKGGAAFRMLDRLCKDGLIQGPPYRATAAGVAALNVPTHCPLCRKKHVGGFKFKGCSHAD